METSTTTQSACPRSSSDILLKKFRPVACIDWMDIHIQSQRPARPNRLRRTIAALLALETAPFCRAVDPKPDSTSNQFVVRLQNPPSTDDLIKFERELHADTPLTDKITVIHWEVSIDFFPRAGTSTNDLRALTMRQMKNLDTKLLPKDAGARADERILDKTRPRFMGTGEHKLTPDVTLCIGERFEIGDKTADPRRPCPLMWRCYFKTTDLKTRLPVEQHRPRVEVQMDTCDAFGGRRPTFHEVSEFRFEEMTRYFSFRETGGLDMEAAYGASKSAVQALVRAHWKELIDSNGHRIAPVHRNKRLRNKPGTQADSALKERCRDALKYFTQKSCKQKSRRKISTQTHASH